MNKHHGKPEAKSSSLVRAKRIFLTNLFFFLCLATVTFFLLPGEEEEDQKAPKRPEKVLSLAEEAYLAGEVQALSEHPGTMPDYEIEWVRKLAEKAIERDRRFDGADAEELTNQYIEGYTAQFDAYYDTRAAREFGYSYGVKFNPEIYGICVRADEEFFDKHRERLEEKFRIEKEAHWYLFCKAFNEGFRDGYMIIKEGVTVQSAKEQIRLFDD